MTGPKTDMMADAIRNAQDSNNSKGLEPAKDDRKHEDSTPKDTGSEPHTQMLYEGPPKCVCCINWVDNYPEDLIESVAEKEIVGRKAIVARMKRSHYDGKPLVLHSIIVQNEHLKSFLEKVFEGYQGITPKLKKLVLKAPFHPFYYRWDRFRALATKVQEQDTPMKLFVPLLHDLLREEVEPIVDEVKDLTKHQVITYKLLWTLFEPTQRLFARKHSQDGMYIHDSHSYTGNGFLVHAKNVNWDGDQFGYQEQSFLIRPFNDTKPIKDLAIYPIDLHESPTTVRESLLERGKKFRDLCCLQHIAYRGPALTLHKDQISIDERVVLDTALFPQKAASLKPLADEPMAPQVDFKENESHVGPPKPGLPLRPSSGFDSRMVAGMTPGMAPGYSRGMPHKRPGPYGGFDLTNASDVTTQAQSADINIRSLTEEQLTLCNSVLAGYGLVSQRWILLMDLNNVQPIVWDEFAFGKLVLPPSHKELVVSFVEAHSAGDVHFDDVIKGKGLGLLMLLVGEPGLGKTLTAEAVAEKLHKPLYILSAGQLGYGAQQIEAELRKVLEMTEKWDAVLLLDECDVFLEARSASQLGHNAVVAVFLRLLEYYKGILIMTTNRSKSMDPAFQSRIHLTLKYPSLTAEAKTSIFKQFVQGTNWAAGDTLTEEQYGKLINLQINGREIRNMVKGGFLLASRDKAPLGFEHIRKVVDATLGEGLLE